MPMCACSSPRRQQAGFSLLEVLIATLVLSVGLLGLAGLQIAGMKTTHNSYQIQQATWLVNDLVERMRLNRTGALAGNYNGTYNDTTACGATPTCATATACTALEMASLDLHQVRCGSGTADGIRNNFVNSVLTVGCDAAGCNTRMTVTLVWDERNASRAGNDVEQFNLGLDVVL